MFRWRITTSKILGLKWFFIFLTWTKMIFLIPILSRGSHYRNTTVNNAKNTHLFCETHIGGFLRYLHRSKSENLCSRILHRSIGNCVHASYTSVHHVDISILLYFLILRISIKANGVIHLQNSPVRTQRAIPYYIQTNLQVISKKWYFLLYYFHTGVLSGGWSFFLY